MKAPHTARTQSSASFAAAGLPAVEQLIAGWHVLAAVLTQVYGACVEELVRREISEPLGRPNLSLAEPPDPRRHVGLWKRLAPHEFGTAGTSLDGSWSPQTFGHRGTVSVHTVVQTFADPVAGLAGAIRLFSVDARSNWRVWRIGAAISDDLRADAR